MSSSSESSQAESVHPENAFASLELLLNQQQQQPEESSMARLPPEPQVDLSPPDAHPAPHNNEPPAVEKPAAVDDHGNNTTSLRSYSPPTLSTLGPTTTSAGFTTGDPQEPPVPEATAAHTPTATIPTGPSPGDADFPSDSGAHDHDYTGQARIETNPSSSMPEERNLAASQQTAHTSQVTTKTNTKRSRGRDQYKHNVPTPSYTSFSPCRNSSNISSSTRRLANSQLDPPPNSLLEKTRRIAMKQTAAAAAAAASTRMERDRGTTSSSAQQRASLQNRKPVPIVNSKSIVGTRYVSFFIKMLVCGVTTLSTVLSISFIPILYCILSSCSLLMLTDPSIGEEQRFETSVLRAEPNLYQRAKGPVSLWSFRKQLRLVPSCLLPRAPLLSSALEPRNGRLFHRELQERLWKLCRNQAWTLSRSALLQPFSHHG